MTTPVRHGVRGVARTGRNAPEPGPREALVQASVTRDDGFEARYASTWPAAVDPLPSGRVRFDQLVTDHSRPERVEGGSTGGARGRSPVPAAVCTEGEVMPKRRPPTQSKAVLRAAYRSSRR